MLSEQVPQIAVDVTLPPGPNFTGGLQSVVTVELHACFVERYRPTLSRPPAFAAFAVVKMSKSPVKLKLPFWKHLGGLF